MEITTPEELATAAPKLRTAITILLEFSEKFRPTAWMYSTADAWVIEKEYLKREKKVDVEDERFENLKEGLEAQMPMLYAFQLSDALMSYFASHSKNSSTVESHPLRFKIYQEILELAEQWEKNNFDTKEVEEGLQNYLREKYPFIAASFHSEVRAQLKTAYAVYSSIRNKSKTFAMVKGFMLPDLAGTTPSEKLLTLSLKQLGLDKKFAGLREAALMLEHIGKKYKEKSQTDWPEYWKIQNELIDIGLRWSEKVHPAFILGAQSTLATMLMIDRADLVATFLIERIAEQQLGELIGVQEKAEQQRVKLKKDLQIILNNFKESLKKNAGSSRVQILNDIMDILLELQPRYGFTEFDLHRWTLSVGHILTTYDHYKPKLGARTTKKPRILWVGDSVSAGMGVQDKEKDKRFVQTVIKAFEEDCEIVNCSIPGQFTTDAANDIEDNIKYFVPDVVVYTGGGNNMLGEKNKPTPERLEEMEADVVRFAKTCFDKGVKEVVWSLGVPATFEHYEDWRKAIPELLAKVKANPAFKDKQECFHVLPLPTDTHDPLSKQHMFKKHDPDEGIHPSVAGHQALATHSIATLKKLLEQRAVRNSLDSRKTIVTQRMAYLAELNKLRQKSLQRSATLDPKLHKLPSAAVKGSGLQQTDEKSAADMPIRSPLTWTSPSIARPTLPPPQLRTSYSGSLAQPLLIGNVKGLDPEISSRLLF